MIKFKLNNNRGATLLFSLVAMAIAVIVCAVVIYAAESNAGRIRSAQAAEQAQLSLNSAASLVRQQFAGTGIKFDDTYTTVKTTTNGTTTETVNPGVVTVTYNNTDKNHVVSKLASGTYHEYGLSLTEGNLTTLQNTLLDWSLSVMNGKANTKRYCYGVYYIKAEGPEGSLNDVKVEIYLDPGATDDLLTQDEKDSHEAEKYYMTVVFSVGDSYQEAITMSFMATVSENTKSRLVSKTSSTAPDVNGNPVTTSQQVVETRHILELSWPHTNVVVNTGDGLEGKR